MGSSFVAPREWPLDQTAVILKVKTGRVERCSTPCGCGCAYSLQPTTISAPPKVVLAWLAQVTQALDHLHSNGVLHRDIKTANLFMTKEGYIKLGDFGVAKVLEHNAEHVSARTTATPGVGTPMYMAPEVCELAAGTAGFVCALLFLLVSFNMAPKDAPPCHLEGGQAIVGPRPASLSAPEGSDQMFSCPHIVLPITLAWTLRRCRCCLAARSGAAAPTADARTLSHLCG